MLLDATHANGTENPGITFYGKVTVTENGQREDDAYCVVSKSDESNVLYVLYAKNKKKNFAVGKMKSSAEQVMSVAFQASLNAVCTFYGSGRILEIAFENGNKAQCAWEFNRAVDKLAKIEMQPMCDGVSITYLNAMKNKVFEMIEKSDSAAAAAQKLVMCLREAVDTEISFQQDLRDLANLALMMRIAAAATPASYFDSLDVYTLVMESMSFLDDGRRLGNQNLASVKTALKAAHAQKDAKYINVFFEVDRFGRVFMDNMNNSDAFLKTTMQKKSVTSHQVEDMQIKSPVLNAFLQDLRLTMRNGKSFNDLFIHPIQRVMRYPLLFGEMLSKVNALESWTNSKDKADVVDKITLFKSLFETNAKNADEYLDGCQKEMATIENELGWDITDLCDDNRKCLLKETLAAEGMRVYVFTDCFVVGKKKGHELYSAESIFAYCPGPSAGSHLVIREMECLEDGSLFLSLERKPNPVKYVFGALTMRILKELNKARTSARNAASENLPNQLPKKVTMLSRVGTPVMQAVRSMSPMLNRSVSRSRLSSLTGGSGRGFSFRSPSIGAGRKDASTATAGSSTVEQTPKARAPSGQRFVQAPVTAPRTFDRHGGGRGYDENVIVVPISSTAATAAPTPARLVRDPSQVPNSTQRRPASPSVAPTRLFVVGAEIKSPSRPVYENQNLSSRANKV